MIVEAHNGDKRDRSTPSLSGSNRGEARRTTRGAWAQSQPRKLQRIEPTRCQRGDQSLQPCLRSWATISPIRRRTAADNGTAFSLSKRQPALPK
jgi:hypothetical protein